MRLPLNSHCCSIPAHTCALNTTRQRGEIIGDGVQDPTATAHPGLLFAADFRLLQQGRQQDFNSPTFSQQGGAFDSSRLAQMVGQLHRQDPGLLGNLLGGAPGGGNPRQSTAAKLALARITAMAIKRLQQR